MKKLQFNASGVAHLVRALIMVVCGCLAAESQAGTVFTPPLVLNSDVVTTSAYYGSAPALASDGAGALITVWTGFGANPVNPQGQDPSTANPANEDIFFARSLDHGKTWTPRAQLKTSWATDAADDLEPAIAADGHGCWVAVWRSRDPLGGALGYDADILAATSTDNGLTWSAPVPVNNDAAADPGKDDVTPAIATDGKGRWIVSWTVLYLNAKGSPVERIWASVSTDNGRSWRAPSLLFGRSAYAPPLGMTSSLATDGNGRWIIVTNGSVSGSPDRDIFAMDSSDHGATWNAPLYQPINPDGYWNIVDLLPAIATDGKGVWIMAWSSLIGVPPEPGSLSPTFNIWFMRSTDNGQTWGPMARLNSEAETGGADNANVHLSHDGAGNWVAIWSTRKWGGDLDLAYAISRDNGLTWSAAAPLNAGALGDTFGDSGGYKSLALVNDRQGHWLAAWDTDNNPGRPATGLRLILGAALSAAEIVCTPTQLRYREGTRLAVDVIQGGKPTSATLTLQSAGVTPLTISGFQFGGAHAADFSLLGAPPLPLILPPGETRALVVRFAPTETVRTLGMPASLNITSDDTSQSTLLIPLMGDAVPVDLSRFTAE